VLCVLVCTYVAISYPSYVAISYLSCVCLYDLICMLIENYLSMTMCSFVFVFYVIYVLLMNDAWKKEDNSHVVPSLIFKIQCTT
jgi:hypothetical protein